MSFYLSNKDYKEMIGIISGDTGSKKGNGASTTYLDTELTAQEPKKQQGIVADTVDAVQMGAWKGASDISHGIGALTGIEWFHEVGDWAAKGADENVASMSDEMKAALNQNAFDGEGQGVRNLRWWAGNLGSLIGQNLDTALTLGAGKVATIGAKQAGKLLLKKEVAEEVGKTAVEQAAKRGIPQKYWNMVGITATMSAMSGGGRYGQKRNEVMGMTNEQLAQIPQFSDEYYSIADSNEGKGKSTEELYTMAKKSFADKVGRDAALNPTAIATDLVTNSVSGLGGGFWGLGSPAKTIKGGLLKGAAVEGGTEAIQGVGEQYALNKAEQDYLNPNKDLTEGMADNAINGAVLGAVFGSAMGGLDTHTDKIAFNNQKRTILNHINTGNDAVDSQLRNYVDMLNHGATELGDLVSASRVQALNNAGIATAKARQAAEEALAEQQAKAKFESDFFGEEQSQQETTSTFKVDPNLERALELHSILGQFRKNDLSRANEFIDTPTIFADEQARKDYVIGRAFDEVRNIAQSYGIDPKDGKAMRHWLEDYAEKAKEYTSNDQQYNSSSNQQDSENLNGQPYNISKQTSEEASSLKEPNQPIDFNLGAATKDLSIQPEVNLGYNRALARQNSNLVEFDLNQPLSNQQSAEYDGINPVGNGLLSTHMNQSQLGRQLTADSSLGDLNSIAKDINADNQIQKDSNSDFRLSLNESADSDFAKAVDTTIQGGKPSRQYIPMGTTPDALKMLGLPDTKVLVSRDVLRKVMLDKHNVTAETLKQLPKQINHPIAIMKSAPQATHDGYVVLTELLERNISTGSDEPIISALHLKNTKDGLEVINIASVYGKNLAGLQNMLNNDLAYWNKTKGSQFIESFGLQLPSKIDSKMMSQSFDNIKTEADLSQYQTSKNDQASKFNPEVQSAQEILNQTFGKAAEHIEVATFANPPKDVRHLITSDVEGWFNPKTGKVTLIADSINATKTMSKEERLQFVAWHEMAHRGINVGYKGSYDSLMQEVGKNKAISQIADAIQAQRKNTDDLAATNRSVAIEEAIAEMMAAHETGKWNELESRYGVEIKKGQRQSTKSWLAMTAQRIKEFLSKIFGVERVAQFSDEDVLNLVANIKKSAVGNFNENDNVRFSRNEELTEERYNQAKENGETELTFHQWQQVRSPEFKAWFGDWENDPENASKVVNPKTGEPLVVYHGTTSAFTVFNPKKLGSKTDAKSARKGFFFSDSIRTGKSYSLISDYDLVPSRYHLSDASLSKFSSKTPKKYRDIYIKYDERYTHFYNEIKSDMESAITGKGWLAEVDRNKAKETVSKYDDEIAEAIKEGLAYNKILDKYFGKLISTYSDVENYKHIVTEIANIYASHAASLDTGIGSPSVMHNYLNIKNIIEIDVNGFSNEAAFKNMNKALDKAIKYGYDGVLVKNIADGGNRSNHYIVFNPNQIKSATDNTGAFSKENDDIRFSRKGESEYQRDLIVTHNISADGIMHADKMGGLPLASVAVAKQSNPLTNFGEVTLIGSRNYIDPKGVNKAQVFGSDIYSPRYPRISYEYSAKDRKALFNRFEKSAKEIEDRSFDYDLTQGLEDTGAKQAMLNSDAVKHQFLKEHNIPYEKAYRDIPKSVHADYPSIQKAIKAGISEEDISSIESADKFEGLFREFIKDYIKDIEGRVSPSPLLKNVIVRAKQALDGDKYAVRTFAESRVKEGLKLQESKKVLDQPETLSNMRKAVSEHEDAFRDYVDSIVETMPVKEKIWNGTDGYGRNKYVAHTIENVVKKLKKDLRGGESFNYGMPNVRAAVTPKFKSIADIQSNKHRIVSKEEFKTARDALEKEGDLLANKLGVSTLDIYDVLWNAVDENTSKAFGYAGIKDTQENRMAVGAFLNKLKALPTEYFEGKAKDITQFSNFAGAVVPDNLAKNAYDVLEKSGVKIFTYDSTDPKARIEAIKQATNQLDEERGGDILFSRANTMQSALDLAMTGVADSEPSAWDSLKSKDFSGFKERFNRAMGKVDEWLADSLRPVNDWIDSMHLEDQTGNTSSRDHEKRRLKDAMYVAKGKRDAINSELEQAYLKPILSKIATLSKQSQNKSHPMDELTMKRMVGNWISARYSIEKNIDLLNRDEKVMRDTKRLLDNAKQNGTSAEVRRLHEAYLKAKEQYDNRKADIYNTDYKNKGNRFKVGVAGGWSIPEAELIMGNTEKHISRSNLEYVADLVYDLNQSRLEVDRASGRYTEAEYQEYKANRHYVPLTGDPNADVDVDIISGAGSNALNIARDKTLKGRTSSEAEDAIDAVWKSIGKSTTYAGFAEFKSRIDDLFETEVALLKDKGYSDAEAREQATANLGISKRKMQGLTRSSDNVLIRKEGSDYYEYELPTQVMESLRNDNVEHANAFLKAISKPTGWYARGITQWTVTFAPMNMMRDTWEKSEFIRVQKLYDKNNRLVDSKTMDKIGRDTIKNAFTDKEVWQATKRLGFGQELRDSVPAERMLKQLLKEGGVSNYGTYLDKTEVDLVKRLKKENNPLAGKLEKVGKVFEGYNKMFDTVSALASYKALVDNGIDSKQAAATTLELTNFRKTGSKMRGIKALYMFSQPTVMGAANLMRYLSTRKGQIRFAAYMAVMTSLYTVLRSMDDEDEGGNKMDQLGDITRYIPIPLGGGKYFKIPVGFGMAQMAWNFSTNIVKGAVGDISLTEAGTNMLVHSLKTFSPVSPSEISAAKYPMEKITLTATPSILQPVMQNVLNRSAFGNKITTNYVRDDKLKAEQSKATTAQFWKDTAIELNDTLGIDMHPEQIKNLFDGYSSMLGSLKELNTIFIENPNREDLGRKTRTPFLNQFIGTTNEFAIQSRYYEASEEAGSVYKEYKSRKERNELGDWLDADKMKLIKFHEEEESIIKKVRSEKANLTRALRSGKISAVAYESGIKRYNKEMSGVQARLLRKYRQMEGLNTH